ncbi:MAG: DUF1365 domain-containing protein [Pseudomonadota bacterium]
MPPDGPLASAVYTGWVRHRRYAPRAHDFRYKLFMLYIDLDEIDTLFDQSRFWSVDRRNVAEFRRSDYLGAAEQPLKDAVLDCVESELGVRSNGAVRMLTHGRYFGYCFNPVTFYYTWHDGAFHAIVAEITNTPWQERHRYVFAVDDGQASAGSHAFAFDKAFHVSPFLDMDMAYRWRFAEPDERLLVHMENWTAGRARAFDATLVLDRQPATAGALNAALWRFPLLTLKVTAGIHWEALKLWLKRNPVYDHPSKRTTTGSP